jgi:hypothetical protein
MKQMSRYIRSSIISASISLGLLLFSVLAQAQPFSVVGFGSKVLSTDSIFTKNTLLILTSEASCTGCKDNLSAYLNSLKIDTARFDIVIVSKIRVNTPLLKRELYNEIKTYYPTASKVYFDIATDSTSMFQHFKAKQTPTLVIFDKSSRTWAYEGYKEVFDGIYLSKRIKQQLTAYFANSD